MASSQAPATGEFIKSKEVEMFYGYHKVRERELDTFGDRVFVSGNVAVYYNGSATFNVVIRCSEQVYANVDCWTTAAPEKLPELDSDLMRSYCRERVIGLGWSRYL